MKKIHRYHMVFLGDLNEHSNREVCRGAAEYAAEKSDLDFDPWPVRCNYDTVLTPSSLRQADCLLISNLVPPRLFRSICSQRRIPHVFALVNGAYCAARCVDLDESAIGKMAAEHLAHRGYRHLAFVGSSSPRWSILRGDGFEKAARDLRLPCHRHEFPLSQVPAFWCSNLNKRFTMLHALLKELPKPCGIMAANDVIACFLVETARYHGIGIPDQVGIIGADNDPIPNAAAGLAISSVQLPFREVGYRAAEMLDRLREGRSVPRRIFLPPVSVVVRASTDAFMVEDPLVRRVQAYIETRRQSPLRVREVIKAMNTTAATINKHFMRFLNMPPSEYILRRRLEYAKDLLRAGRHNVEEVAYTSGFSSCSYFCLIFKKCVGRSPGSFRP